VLASIGKLNPNMVVFSQCGPMWFLIQNLLQVTYTFCFDTHNSFPHDIRPFTSEIDPVGTFT